MVANARAVLARLECYELEVLAEVDQIEEQRRRLSAEDAQVATALRATAGSSSSTGEAVSGSTSAPADALSAVASRAGRRKLAAQASLFDLANQKIVEELRSSNLEKLSAEEAKELLIELRKRAF